MTTKKMPNQLTTLYPTRWIKIRFEKNVQDG